MKNWCCLFLLLTLVVSAGASDRTGLLKNGVWKQKLRQDHPRLFFHKDMIPAIRATAANRPAEFAALKAAADALPADAPYVEKKDTFTRDANGVIKPTAAGGIEGYRLLQYAGGRESAQAALMYLITGEKVYKEKAHAYLRLFVKALDFSARGQWWMDLMGQTRINAMLAYDILYNDLSDQERREIILPILDYIRKTQPDGAYQFRRTIGSHKDGNYGELALQYFLGVTLCGDGIADQEADQMLQNGAALFVRMLDHRDRISAGSGLLASATFDYSFGAYPLATHLFFLSWKSAFGEDISDRWKQMLSYHRFAQGMMFHPDDQGRVLTYGIGDLWHVSNRKDVVPLYTHLAWNIHFYGEKYPETAAEIYHFLKIIPPEKRQIDIRNYPMFPFLLTEFDPALAGKGTAMKQDHFYAPRFGVLTMWSGREKGDTYASFRFGANEENHQHYDELSFVIFKHDFLALDAGSRTEMDHHHNFAPQSVAHNTILIHQPQEPMPFFWKSWSHKPDGKVYYNHGGQNNKKSAAALALKNTPEYLYAAGDATRSYDAGKSREVIRQFVYLRPDIFVIYDRVASVRADQKKEFLLHTQNKPQSIAPGIWQADLGKGRLFCQTLLPVNARVTLVGGKGNEFYASGRNWPLEPNVQFRYAGNWRMEVSSPENLAESRFCHVLQASDTGVSAPLKAELLREGEEDVVCIGDWKLYFRRTGKVGFRIEKI